MDNGAAAQYLDMIYGTRQGYVAVAYKDPKDTTSKGWQETQFAWPSGKDQLLGWARKHATVGRNVFVCPAVRTTPRRIKGDMDASQWLWADVDMQNVPDNRYAEIQRRIAEMGTYVVSSGTGENVHAYVKLTKAVGPEDHAKLNTGLRDYLLADNKQADNSFLRLPGTTNWKTEAGSEVAVRGGHGKAKAQASLMAIPAFKRAKVPMDAEAIPWEFVEVEGMTRRMRSIIEMPIEESVAKYGNRHKAVWATTKDLYVKWGMGPDEIHSLMGRYPAALSKAADENGYDVHRDIDRCISSIRATEALTDEETADIEDDVFELATDADDEAEFETNVDRLVKAKLAHREAEKRARAVEAERSWVQPPPTVSRSLTDALSVPAEPEPFLIDGIMPIRGNVILTAQYKSGKTDLLMGSLARSLADAVPFLSHFEVACPEAGLRVGHWNLEMDEGFLIDQYIRPTGYENTDNLIVASLQGYRVSLLSELGRAWTVAWLKDNEVKVWTIDSIAQLARMAGVSENSNDEMSQLFGTISEIKTEAGVDVCMLIAHTGRAQQEEGKEHARAATVIDDWPDFRWVMTVDGSDVRWLQVQGRGKPLKPSSLLYDADTHRYTFEGKTKGKADTEGWVQVIMGLVNARGEQGLTENSLFNLMKAHKSIGKISAVEFMVEASDNGFIMRKKGATGRGGKAPWMHYPVQTTKGKVEGHDATPGPVDLTGVKDRGRRTSH